MKQALINLLKVKSLMTIAIMIVFVTLSLTHNMSDELVASVISSIVTYYFTKKEGE